jgi:hypothetical protein
MKSSGTDAPDGFHGPAPFVVGGLGGTISTFADAPTTPTMTHHRLPNMTALRKDANTRLPRTANARPCRTFSNLYQTNLHCFKNDIILTTVDHTNDARPRHFRSKTRRGVRMRRCTLILDWSANTLLQCSDLNGAQHEQPPALHPILQPRHTAIFSQ